MIRSVEHADALAGDLLQDTLEKKNGRSGHEVGAELSRQAADIRAMQETMSVSYAGVLNLPPEYFSSIATTLEDTSRAISSTVGGATVEELEDGVAGQAYMGATGTETIHVGSMINADGTIDQQWMKDVVEHEKEHTRQSGEWNATEVDVGGVILTQHDIAEAGAMSVQSSIEGVSADYKGIYAKVTGLVSAGEAREAARSGDLVGLADKIRQNKGLPEESYAVAA